jgi:hypothetical protein
MAPPLSTALLGRACRIFLEAAYPEGPESIPPPRSAYWALPEQQPLDDCLTAGGAVCQKLREGGFALRLGRAGYPHLKLCVQEVEINGAAGWVFSVDTHDAFSREKPRPAPDHPDAAPWQELQAANRALKERIETAWEAAGLTTHNAILRGALSRPPR